MKFLLFLIFFFTNIFVKTQVFSGNFSMPTEKVSKHFYDKSIQNVYYQLTFVSNPKKESNKKEVICLLQLGRKFSRFGELNVIKYDSILEKYSTKDNIGAKEFNEISPFVPKWRPIVLKDLNDNAITIHDFAKNTFKYTEEQPLFNWKIENNTKEILGYVCKKASTEFRGRKYVAWYAIEIPINNGPYLFNGLPGLILEIEDSKKHYHFLAIALDKKNQDIYLRDEKKILTVKRDKFKNVQKAYYDNPSFYMGSSYDSEGKVISEKPKPRPYNPIELE